MEQPLAHNRVLKFREVQTQRVIAPRRQVRQRVRAGVIACRLIHQLRRGIGHAADINRRVRVDGSSTAEARVVGEAAGPAAAVRRERPLIDDLRIVEARRQVPGVAPDRHGWPNRQSASAEISRVGPVVRIQEVAAVLAEHHRSRTTQSLLAIEVQIAVGRTQRIPQVRRPVERQSVPHKRIRAVVRRQIVRRQIQIAARRHSIQRPARTRED